MTDERVLCIPERHFQQVGAFFGFRPASAEYAAALLDPAAASFHSRAEAEPNPQLKQLIPYIVLRHGDRLFHYRRGTAGTETRLAAMRSVGVGGHISECDATAGADPYRTGMLRELAEEIAHLGPYQEQLLGFVYDDRTPVGSVHLGVVHLLELHQATAQPREAALSEAGFAPLALLKRQAEQFETWSQFVLSALTGEPLTPNGQQIG
jgi:predicted NUDIX family phosphoesterase